MFLKTLSLNLSILILIFPICIITKKKIPKVSCKDLINYYDKLNNENDCSTDKKSFKNNKNRYENYDSFEICKKDLLKLYKYRT